MSEGSVFLGLGSNLGKREGFLKSALEVIMEDKSIRLVAISPIYETEPVGFVGQGKFLNLVAEIRTDMRPRELFMRLEKIETRVGRKAEFKNGPREIDIDILLYGDEVFEEDRLTIPHPGLNKRAFALTPLLDLNPRLLEPTTNVPYAVYLKRMGEKKEVTLQKSLNFKSLVK